MAATGVPLESLNQEQLKTVGKIYPLKKCCNSIELKKERKMTGMT